MKGYATDDKEGLYRMFVVLALLSKPLKTNMFAVPVAI